MKRFFLSIVLLATAIAVVAVPARKGIWRTITTPDGTEVRVQLTGDEHLHFWAADDGRTFVEQGDDTFVAADMDRLRATAAARRRATTAASRQRRVTPGQRTHYTGRKKGLVILMQFTDTKFKSENNLTRYKDILNKTDYESGLFQGSVADYFRAQSGGQFELTFDCVGPFTAQQQASYYGSNDSEGLDKHPEELVVEACKAADSQVDFRNYDWDGDGEVEQVFVLYAGKGEADGGGSSTIWPHMWTLHEANTSLTLDGMRIDTYACSNEVDRYGSIEGIGVFCHEFSHCLGFPDFYDVNYGGYFGMGSWDLMDQGSYNGNTFLPAGYSAYEKWMAGWLELTELSTSDVSVSNLRPMSEDGQGYIIYNDGHRDEYYVVENRQRSGWDAALPGRGLMVTHVDFDQQVWIDNIPNTHVTAADMEKYGYSTTNDHQRFTIFHADNTEKTGPSTDLYPYGNKDSLTATSRPAATLYNRNAKGTLLMEGALLDIRQNSNGTMDFRYRASTSSGREDPEPPEPGDDYLLYESFDQCNGKGGNDGDWSSSVASAAFTPDNQGWEYLKAYGGYRCARFGNSSTVGAATTPAFIGDGEAKMTFRAAAWGNDGTELTLSVAKGNATIEPSTVTLKALEWNDYTVLIKGLGSIRVNFSPDKRFFLDEVLIVSTAAVGISDVGARQPSPTPAYDLQGRRIATHSARPGLYIIGGKKILIK